MIWLLAAAWLALTVFWIVTIVDVVRTDPEAWVNLKPGKSAWVCTVIFFGWIGALGYWLVTRSAVRGAANKLRTTTPTG